MNIHQLSVTYQPEQDRVLVRVSTTAGEEMRLWLTRRLMRGFWPIFSRSMEELVLQGEPAAAAAARPELRPTLAGMQREQFLQQADFATPYQDPATRPLGDEPLLVSEVDATVLPSKRLRLGFSELLPGRPQARNFQMEAEAVLLQGFQHLLLQALDASGWKSAFDAPAAATPTLPMAGGDDPERPRWLN